MAYETGHGEDLSVAEMVLISTAEAANWTTNGVQYDDIVVRAWQAFPDQFSLSGYPDFPDASDVHKPLYRTLKSAELVESLGNKTFRVTELGLTKARSIIAATPGAVWSRKMIDIKFHPNEFSQSVIRAAIDAAASDAQVVAMRLLGATLSIRFPDEQQLERNGAIAGEHPAVGNTIFSVLIPASIEDLQRWADGETPGVSRRLLVRDSVLSGARHVLAEVETAVPLVVYGIETFLGQMIDGMAAYDGPRTATVLTDMVARYNQNLPLALPRLRLKIVDDSETHIADD